MENRLTFENGMFVLQAGKDTTLTLDSEWALRGRDFYATNSFKAAARFKEIADGKALKILEKAFVKRYPLQASPLPSFLDPHQKEGVEWVLTRSRSYLAHAPGAGKTLEALTAAFLCGAEGQALFIVPPALIANWARETLRAVDEFKLPFRRAEGAGLSPTLDIIPDSSSQQRVNWFADLLIIPDSMLTKSWVLKRLIPMKKRFVSVDEASRFKESDAERTRALFGGPLKSGLTSPGLVKQARHSVLLDGSPMPNRPMELWAPTYAMSPESIDFMTKEEFGFRYCGAKLNRFGAWEFKHSAREEELHDRLTKSFMHVVLESALKHPERRRSMLFMVDDVRSREQRRWEAQNLDTIVKLSARGEEGSQGELARFRRELGLRKVPWVSNYVRERLERKNESILLFAWHLEVIEDLKNSLLEFKPGVVIGGTAMPMREHYFEKFQSGKTRLIIGNILAMGRGNNLQRGDRAVFAEYSWSDQTNLQAEKRISRRGNDKEFMRADYVVCPGSMDEPILRSVFTKAGRVKKVIG